MLQNFSPKVGKKKKSDSFMLDAHIHDHHQSGKKKKKINTSMWNLKEEM
jgi:hypothetical protein